jgi:hypothetical protein
MPKAFHEIESPPLKKLLPLLILILAACGKRGDPHPPVPVIPKATTDLTVSQRGSKVLLTWSYPSLTTAGQNLNDIRRVVVYRYVEEAPASAPTVTPTQFKRSMQKLDSIEGAALPKASSGAKLTLEDSPAFHTTDGRPVRLNYAVTTESPSARGDVSNVVTIVPQDVPQPPANVVASAKAEGVVLTWTAPDKARLIGYDVYRFAHGAPVDELAAPINSAPVTATTYTDAPPYGAYDYYVTAVVAASPRIESDPSAAASATFKDLVPPPAPKNLSVLIETKTARLVWDPVDAPDLAGYRVYRVEGVGHPATQESKPLLFTPQLLTATNWSDHPDPGLLYYYLVTAVDKSGNESTPAKSEWIEVPKTP